MPCPELNEPPRCLTSAAQTRQRKNTLPSFPQPTKNHPGARRRQHQWAAAGARQVSKAEALARRRANATAAQGATGVPGRGGVGAQGAQGCDGAAPCQRALAPARPPPTGLAAEARRRARGREAGASCNLISLLLRPFPHPALPRYMRMCMPRRRVWTAYVRTIATLDAKRARRSGR